jgi:hypothetical protein
MNDNSHRTHVHVVCSGPWFVVVPHRVLGVTEDRSSTSNGVFQGVFQPEDCTGRLHGQWRRVGVLYRTPTLPTNLKSFLSASTFLSMYAWQYVIGRCKGPGNIQLFYLTTVLRHVVPFRLILVMQG